MTEEQPLDPAAAQVIAKARRLMLVSALFTLLAVAGVLVLVGYRVFRSEGSAPRGEVNLGLPQGAKVIGTAVGDDRLVLTIDLAGRTEVHVFDLRTLQPRGRITLQPAP